MTAEMFVDFILPQLAIAGGYSREIQHAIQAHPAKTGETAFQQALSDADLSVQSFLEVCLLSRFPDAALFSEERDQSLNARYFPKTAPFEVLLDPIDGTRAYLDGDENYQIIITLRKNSTIEAALCYVPRHDRCFAAIRGKGAFVLSTHEMQKGLVGGQKLYLSPDSRRILAFNSPDEVRKLQSAFRAIDILDTYLGTGKHHGFTELFRGEAAAFIHHNPQLIDAGAIAFIAQQAGAELTGLDGQPIDFAIPADQRLPGLIVSASPALHQEILQALRA